MSVLDFNNSMSGIIKVISVEGEGEDINISKDSTERKYQESALSI